MPSLHRAVAPAGWDVPPPEPEEPLAEELLPPLPEEPELAWCVAVAAGLTVLVTVTVGCGLAALVTVTVGAGAAVCVAVAVVVAVTVTSGRGVALELAWLDPVLAIVAPMTNSVNPPAHTRLRLCNGRMSGMGTGSGGRTDHGGPGWF
ncbi:hypothetical protein B446_05750 [Streptomyces collinus Tu 365]|uniref:Uncharacterized protein n=1 Tax=Streptomyces collinus (strain DSM 40733 / Tue 365) TaxID=1214242 RepID=S5UQ76_STRC3|nr:hypothetical protein B446_05750 [Streptomyces collinus Tu 365]